MSGEQRDRLSATGERLQKIVHDNMPKMPHVGGSGGGEFNYEAFGRNFLYGAAAGAVAKTLAAPIERVRPMADVGHGFWTGHMATVMRAIPTEGLNFAFYDHYKQRYLDGIDYDREPLKFCAMSVAAGAAAGVSSLAILYPVDSAYGTRLGADVYQVIEGPEGRPKGRDLLGESGMKEKASEAWKTTKDAASKIKPDVSSMKEKASDAWQTTKDTASQIKSDADIGRYNKVDPVEAGRQTVNAAREAGKNLRESAFDAAREMKDTAKDVGRKVYDTAGQMTETVKETAKEVTHKVREGDVRGVAQTFGDKWKAGGMFGLYRGFLPAATCTIVYRLGYFSYYDIGKAYLKPNLEKSGFLKSWAIAQASVITAGYATHPFDVVRHRLFSGRYHGSLDCWADIYRNEGLGTFYRGASTNVFRSTGGALALVFYDYIKRYMYDKNRK